MLIDNERKFIFIHIPKTAGTSVTLAFGYDKRPQNPHRVDKNILTEYKSYLRCCFIRNPWDRLYSSFNYAKKMSAKNVIQNDDVRKLLTDQSITFEDFVLNYLSKSTLKKSGHFRHQLSWITRAQPQFIGRFENLTSDFQLLARYLHISETNLEVPVTNKTTKRNSYLDAYSNQMIDKVKKLYEDDISYFGYKFELQEPIDFS